jgi:hypothetical protein
MAQLIDIMMSLILVIPNKIPVDLFSDEVEEIIADGHDDLADIFKVTTATGLLKYRMSNSKNQIRLTLDPTKLRGLEYRFQLESGSTAKKTKEQQLKGLLDFLDFIGKMPNALQEYREATGKVLDWEYIFKQYGHSADLKNMEKMFTMAPVPPAAPTTPTADTGAPADDADMMAAEQALGGGQPAPAPAMPVTMPAPMPMPAPVAPQIQHPAIQQAMMRADALMAQ